MALPMPMGLVPREVLPWVMVGNRDEGKKVEREIGVEIDMEVLDKVWTQ